jgi:peptidoglycan glycosyltransferase
VRAPDDLDVPTPGAARHGQTEVAPRKPAHAGRSRSISANVFRTGIAIACAFSIIALGAGWWQVVEAQRLATAPDNPAVLAFARRAIRGPILDRNGQWLARSGRDPNGEATREYRDQSISPVVGYASRLYGTAGLERTYNAELLGLSGADPFGNLLSKLESRPGSQLGLRLSLDLRLQRAAVKALGADSGAVVMLDPSTGEVLALASTPVFDASAIADPGTATATFERLQADRSRPLLPRATLGRYVPGSVFKIVTGIAGLDSGAVSPGTTFPQQPAAEKTGLLVDGFRIRDGHHPQTTTKALDLTAATEVSCNIWYALAGLATGGDRLVAEAARLGFGSAIPFDLPTAVSRVTSGGGRMPGGFADDAELASAAFGQGQTFVTPLQMALVAATVANDGVLMKPHLVTQFTGTGPGARTIPPETWRRVMSPDNALALQAAMRQAVEGKLGRLFTTGAKVPGVSTAGKSGTAQLGGTGEPHSWFIGFAPVENPKVAIAVLVERGGRGAERAAPLAGAMMAMYFQLYGKP